MTAMIMAGGSGTRMSDSGSELPKPLVRVSGVALIERNFNTLLQQGFKEIYISVSKKSGSVKAFIQDRLKEVADTNDVTLTVVTETHPLGNIGAAGLVRNTCNCLLVVFADNLTCLDLAKVWRFHNNQSADITLATHQEHFRMPYGAIELGDNNIHITNYTEKPNIDIRVSSGISVLGTWALKQLLSNQPKGISELSQLAIRCGRRVNSYHHNAPWIDVNSLADISRAESLVTQRPQQWI